MSSFTRRLIRNQLKKTGSRKAGPRVTRMLPDGGYEVLNPTKGWQRFSAARLRAIAKLAELEQRILSRRWSK